MSLLIAGLALWTVVHLLPTLAPAARERLTDALGAKGSRGLVAVLVLTGLALIVVGWRSTTPAPLYTPPAWGGSVAFLLMFAAVVLFGAAHARTSVKRLLRHPMLVGLVLWALAHLLANGDSRSVVLFGVLGVWALIEIPLINRREGAWRKPPAAALKSDVILAAVGVVVFLVLIATHRWFAGVPLASL